MGERTKRCFVIMPFGEKEDVDKKRIDFDEIYEQLIEVAITGAPMREAGGPKLECIRCDKINKAGWVHRQMISHIAEDEVAIVDLSTLNPNVFYELGVRHALRKSVTVLLCRKGTHTPFNIEGFKCIFYDPDDANDLEEAQLRIAEYVANGLNGLHTDSLVYEVLEGQGPIGIPPKRLDPGGPHYFELRNVPKKRIGIVTGDLRYVKGIDVWVNSENTNMQMARFFERSASSVIRYLGAKRDRAGAVAEDTVAEELAREMGTKQWVGAGTILMTSAGELEKSHGVKRIFHVAAVQGELGVGYAPVSDLGACVRNVLETADLPECAEVKIRSILIPLMGTGTGGASLTETVRLLINAAVGYFEHNPRSAVSAAHFLALTDQQRDACFAALEKVGDRVPTRTRATRSSIS